MYLHVYANTLNISEYGSQRLESFGCNQHTAKQLRASRFINHKEYPINLIEGIPYITTCSCWLFAIY